MASPPCCPPGSYGLAPPDTGHVPAGKWEEVAGLQTYIVGNQDAPTVSAVIFAFHDVFGPRTGRHKRVCDEIAAAMPDCLVCMPDLFDKTPIIGKWPGLASMLVGNGFQMVRRTRYRYGWGAMWPAVEKLMVGMEQRVGRKVPYLSFGFCWGAWLAYRCSAMGCLAGAAGLHPAVKVNNQMQRAPHNISEADLARAVACPLLMLPAGNDEPALKPGGAFFEMVKERHPASRSIEHPGMWHGWVSRGTEPDALLKQPGSPQSVAEAQRAAVDQTVTFFREVLETGSGATSTTQGISPQDVGLLPERGGQDQRMDLQFGCGCCSSRGER